MTVAEALREAAERLTHAGVSDGAWDAERLLRHVLGWDRARLFVASEERIGEPTRARFLELVGQRAERRPLQHLIGTQAFWRHEFLVSPDALIPRPETELIVEAAIECLRGTPRPTIVDVGTGSGCIALSLAMERPDASVHAVDLSEAALAIARQNAQRLGLLERTTFHLGHLLDPVAGLAGGIDLVASNPPYVDRSDPLPPEVGRYEPALALFPPQDRFSVYRLLAPAAARTLRPGGHLIVEVGATMAEQVCRICEAAELSVARVLSDLQGIPRTIVAVATVRHGL
jgi:release factor glutamine methyltransferase